MNWTNEKPFQALALTGGGYRGLFTAHALATMEAEIKAPIASCFDLTCGTSIGGIVALAAAFEVKMEAVVKVFLEYGDQIFPIHKAPNGKMEVAWDLYKHSKKARYSVEPLREAITKLIPENAVLGDALHPVAIPSVNVTQGQPQVFKTRHKEEWNRDWKLKVLDVALATSAAPTFFELAEIQGSYYADGGLFANAPDLIALHEAEYFFNVPVSAIKILSVGTTTKSYSISSSAGRNFGISDWMQDQRLFSVMISAQQQMVDQLVKHRLQGNYFRIDHEPSHEQSADLGLDVATESAKKTLIALAYKTVTDVLTSELSTYLTNKPQLNIFRD